MLLDDLLITYPDGSIRDAAEGLIAGLARRSCVLWFSSTWLLGRNARTRLMLSRANIVGTNMCNHFSRCYQCLRVAAGLLFLGGLITALWPAAALVRGPDVQVLLIRCKFNLLVQLGLRPARGDSRR